MWSSSVEALAASTRRMRLKRAPVRVTLVDRHNHHLFQPLLYQVATATLSPSDIASPLRGILGRYGISVLLAEATGIDVAGKRVLLADGELTYDFLIVATGATHSYFGHDEWARYAPGLKTIEDAVEIRRQVLLAFEQAEREPDPARRRELLTFVIVGGGATGVELAGSLSEISRHALVRDFQNIDPTPGAHPAGGGGAPRAAHLSGEPVHQGAQVAGEAGGGGPHGRPSHEDRRDRASTSARSTSGRTRSSGRRGWRPRPLARSLGVELDRAGRVPVTPELTAAGPEGRLRHRRPGALPGEGPAGSGRGARGDAGGQARGGEHPARSSRASR